MCQISFGEWAVKATVALDKLSQYSQRHESGVLPNQIGLLALSKSG